MKTIATIHIFHTNDVHSHFDAWPQIRRFVQQEKKQAAANEEACFFFDIGDHMDRAHPYTEGTAGRGNVHLLNEAGCDAVTIGNNEGITMSKQELSTVYENALFDVILCNVKEPDGTQPYWAKPYKIIETEDGVRIGILGATARYIDFYDKLGWQVTDPHAELQKIAQSIRQETDLIVCLSHLGVNEDRRLASECPEIDIILGAHTHHLFRHGEWVDDTLLAATGKFGEYVGHVKVMIDLLTRVPVQMEANVYRTASMEQTEADVEEVQELIEQGKREMEEPVFYNPSALTQQLFSASPLSSFFGRALIAYTSADCAMFNAGIFLGSLDEGWVTKNDLHSLLPHPINPSVIRLTGTELREVYEQSLNEEWPAIEIRGLGFRGTIMGAMIHERLYENKYGQLFAGNREVKPSEIYTLATLDMFTFGYFFPALKDAPKEYYMPEFIRDVFAWYGRKYFHG